MLDSYLYIFNTILIVGVIQGFIFNGVSLLKNKPFDKAVFFLNMTVMFLSINNLQAWLIDQKIVIPFYYIKYLRVSWSMFLAPMLYVFLIHYLRIGTKTRKIIIITISLFLISILVRIVFLKSIHNQENSERFNFLIRRFNSIEDIFSFIYTIPIFLYTVHIFFRKSKRMDYVLQYDNLKWINTFFILSGIVLSFWLIALFLNYKYVNVNSSYFYSPLRLGTSFIIYWIGYQGMFQQKFLKERIFLRDKLKSEDVFSSSDKLTHLKGKELNIVKHKNYFQDIDEFVINYKKFNDPNLSLDSLAGDLNISTSFLSMLINKFSNQHFTDYINKYRIEQVKSFLLNNEYQNYTIMAIGLESGFNSKSTFYSAFKKHVGMTPIQFKKSMSSKNKFVS